MALQAVKQRSIPIRLASTAFMVSESCYRYECKQNAENEDKAKLKGIMKSDDAVAETIENNMRKLIINESPVDPAYYEKMSKLLDALIEQRRKGVVTYTVGSTDSESSCAVRET